MKAVLTVVGNDRKGIIGKISQSLSEFEVNIEDISQTILKKYFNMIMIIEIDTCTLPFCELQKQMKEIGKNLGIDVRVIHEDIFQSMHNI